MYNFIEVIRMKKILSLQSVEKYYGNGGNIVKAIDNISFDVLWKDNAFKYNSDH